MNDDTISHYQLGRLLGRGGMGEVYEALDLQLGRHVALKFITAGLSEDSQSLQRFEREARAVASLHHPHIATLFEFDPRGPRPFIAMELVAGPNLRERMRGGRLSVSEAVGIARDVAAALAAAHDRGIVHRDIKPENLMFDEYGTVKVMDFGLARATNDPSITSSSSAMGTPAYQAPEMARGSSTSASDVFSLGVVLYEMLTGEPPFQASNLVALLYEIVNLEPRPVHELRSDVPEGVAAILQQMMKKDPAERPASAKVAAELAGWTSTPFSVGPGVVSEGASRRRRRRRRGLAVGILLGCAAVLVLAVSLSSVAAEHRREAVLFNNRAQEALKRHDYRGAQALLQAALRRDSRNGPALINLGTVYYGLGQTDSAVIAYGRVLQKVRDPRRLAEAHYNLGEINRLSESWSSAVRHFEQALSLDSSNAIYYNNYGLALIGQGRSEDARRLLVRGAARFPGVYELLKNLGFADLQLHRDHEAEETLTRAVDLVPDRPEALGLRARARARTGDAAGALDDWAAYQRLRPDSVDRAAVSGELLNLGVLKR